MKRAGGGAPLHRPSLATRVSAPTLRVGVLFNRRRPKAAYAPSPTFVGAEEDQRSGRFHPSPLIFQIPVAFATGRVPNLQELALHEDDRARQPDHLAMCLDEFAEPRCADKLDVQLDGSMGLAAGCAVRRHAHRLIGERGEHSAMDDVDKVQMLGLDDEAEPGIAVPPRSGRPLRRSRSA